MTFTTLTAKLTGMKMKLLAGTAIAAGALMLAAPAAQAQRLAFGVTIGGPVYAAPAPVVVYTGPGYYDGIYFRDYNGWRAHEMTVPVQRFDRDRDSYRHDNGRVDRGRNDHFDRR